MNDADDTPIALLTRYSVRSPAFMKLSRIEDEARRAQWFGLRSKLFTAITLPSVSAQSRRPDRWYLYLAEGDEPLFEEHVGRVDRSWIRPIYVRDGEDFAKRRRAELEADFAGSKSLFVCRADNDDALHTDYFRRITQASRESGVTENHFLLYRWGCRWDGRKMQVVDYPSNPFVSMYSSDWKNDGRDPLVIPHTRVLEYTHLLLGGPEREALWLQILHGANASNQFMQNYELTTDRFAALRPNFNILPEADDVIEVHRKVWKTEPEHDHSRPVRIPTGQMTGEKAFVRSTQARAAKPEIVPAPAAAAALPAAAARLTRADRLNSIAALVGARSYLEVGVRPGGPFGDVTVERKVGVDIAATDAMDGRSAGTGDAAAAGARIHRLSSDAYFAGPGRNESFDLVLISGLHTFEQVLVDFNSALLTTHEKSVIVIDVSMPADVYGALPDRQAAQRYRKLFNSKSTGWHGDVYKLVVYIHDFFPALSFVTTSESAKQTVVWRQPRAERRPRLGNLERISRLDYFWLLDNTDAFVPVKEQSMLDTLSRWREGLGVASGAVSKREPGTHTAAELESGPLASPAVRSEIS